MFFLPQSQQRSYHQFRIHLLLFGLKDYFLFDEIVKYYLVFLQSQYVGLCFANFPLRSSFVRFLFKNLNQIGFSY